MADSLADSLWNDELIEWQVLGKFMQVTHIQHFETKLGANDNHKQTTLSCIHSNEAGDISQRCFKYTKYTSGKYKYTKYKYKYYISCNLCCSYKYCYVISSNIYYSVLPMNISQ